MRMMVILSIVIAVSTIVYGVKAIKKGKKANIKRYLVRSISTFSVCLLGFIILGAHNVLYATETAQAASVGLTLGDGFKYLAAALSTGLATIGTGVAVGSAGSSAIGAVSEDSTILGKTLIFVGMAEGIAIYGMIISILILFV